MVDWHETDGRIETERVDMAKTTPSKRVMTSRCHHACPQSLKQASKQASLLSSVSAASKGRDGSMARSVPSKQAASVIR